MRGYRLNEGDVIRLARLKYRVIEMDEGMNSKPEKVDLC